MFFQKIILFILLLLYPLSCVCGMHHTNRYLPFLERPRVRSVKNFSDFSSYLFFASSSSVLENGKTRSKNPLPELFGEYDLKDIIDSLKEVREKINGQVFTNPFITVGGAEGVKFVDKSFLYSVHGKIKTVGVAFQYEQKIHENFSAGVYVPFMQISNNQRFTFKLDEVRPGQIKSNIASGISLSSTELDLVNKARRAAHDAIGLSREEFVESGVGDIDLYFKYYNDWDYRFMMRKIALDFKIGFLFPTSEKRRIHNPASIPFMGNGHFGGYIEADTELEIKADWKLGLMLGLAIQENKTQRERMAVGSEPYIYSALEGDLRVRQGYMLKISPYFELSGLADGVSAQFRVTHLKHGRDTFLDKRPDADQRLLRSNLEKQEEVSRWKANFFTLQILYDSEDAIKNWWFKPKAFVTYDVPLDWFGGTRAIRHHQLALGLELHF